MYNQEAVRDHETHKLFWDFEISTDNLTTWLSDSPQKKENLPIRWLCRSDNPQRKNKSNPKERPCKRTKKNNEHGGDGDTYCNWCTWDNTQRIGKGTELLRNKRTSRDNPDYNIFMIGQNTEKSPVDLRRLAVTKTPVTSYQLIQVWKTLNRVKEKFLKTNKLGPSQRTKKLRSMRVRVIPVVVGTLGTVPKMLGGIENQRKNRAYLDYSRLARILRRVMEMWSDLLFLSLQWKTTSEHLHEKPQVIIIIIIIIWVLWRCLWCNGRHRKWTRRHRFKS